MLNIGLGADLPRLVLRRRRGGVAAVGAAEFGEPSAIRELPLCLASINRKSRVCANCKRDLPDGWNR